MLNDIIIFCGMLASILSFFVLCAIYALIQEQVKVNKEQVNVNKAQVMAQLCSMLDSETLEEIFKD